MLENPRTWRPLPSPSGAPGRCSSPAPLGTCTPNAYYLHRVVFPALEERLKARFHHLEPVDLRWGVETRTQEEPVDADEDARQQARELLILKICLDEIERSRPFIIGLLGDRYGSTPEEIPPVPHRPGALVFGEASLELVQ